MKAYLNFIIGFLILSLSSYIFSQDMSKVLVLEADTLNGTPTQDTQLLTSELSKAISRIGAFEVSVKTQKEIKYLYQEQGETQYPILTESSLGKIAGWLNADYVVSGTLGRVEQKRYAINLKLFDVKRDKIASTVSLNLIDFKHRLLQDRIARLLLWERLTVVCNLPEYDAVLNGTALKDETKDMDYPVWLLEPGKKYILEVRAKKANYSTFRQEFIPQIAGIKIVDVKLKNRLGILEVKANPEADVYINDNKIGETTLYKQLLEGNYALRLEAFRHYDVSKNINIAPEETTLVQEILPVNYSSFRRNGIISFAVAALFVGGGLWASSEADKAYDRYIETMDVGEMNKQRDKAKKLDNVSYVSYGIAGGFVLWSTLEWIGLMTAHEPFQEKFSEKTTMDVSRRFNLSCDAKGLTLKIELN